MRYLLVVVVVMLFVLPGYCQQLDKGMRLDEVIRYKADSVPYEREIYRYDAVGNKIGKDSYEMEEGKWRLSRKSVWGYDKRGNLILMEHYEVIDDVEKKFNRFTFQYEENDKLIRKEHFIGQDNEWRRYYKNVFEYDDDLNMVLWERYTAKNNEWEIGGRSVYHYYGMDLKIEYTYYMDAEWKLSKKFIYKFDEKGKEVFSESYKPDENEWKYSWREEWTYNEMGDAIYKEFYEESEGGWLLKWKYKWEIEYDDVEKISEVCYRVFSDYNDEEDRDWEIFTKRTSEVMNSGLILETSYWGNKEEWKKDVESFYIKRGDDKLLVLERFFYDSEDNGLLRGTYAEYYYSELDVETSIPHQGQ